MAICPVKAVHGYGGVHPFLELYDGFLAQQSQGATTLGGSGIVAARTGLGFSLWVGSDSKAGCSGGGGAGSGALVSGGSCTEAAVRQTTIGKQRRKRFNI